MQQWSGGKHCDSLKREIDRLLAHPRKGEAKFMCVCMLGVETNGLSYRHKVELEG